MDRVHDQGLAKVPRHGDEGTYSEQEVVFTNGDITIAGTLTIPEGSGRQPAVILISGSGPVDRDEAAFGWRPLRILSGHLARSGIAALRCDSRGVGGSTGDSLQATTSDLADDALAGFRLLRLRDDINTDQIGLLGHSEGGLIAPLVASRCHDVAFIVCVSGPGRPGEETILMSNEFIARAHGASDEELGHIRRMGYRLHELLRGEANGDDLRRKTAQLARLQVELELRHLNDEATGVDEMVEARVACLMQLHTSPWFRFFIDYDPGPALSMVACPTLLLFGELDLQVPPQIHQPLMVQALSGGRAPEHTVRVFSSANHLFQRAVTGSPLEYGDLPGEFVPGFLHCISDWMLGRLDTRPS